MIAIDTNILVYARREGTRFHVPARDLVKSLTEGFEPWAIAWSSVYEFLRVVTHPRIFDPPTELDVALDDLETLFSCPSLILLGEGSSHAAHLRRTMLQAGALGNLAHDAHIAALALEHGVEEILTTDRDFSRFGLIRARNPFLDSEGAREKSPGYRIKVSRRQRAAV